jgi:hypothetical protein
LKAVPTSQSPVGVAPIRHCVSEMRCAIFIDMIRVCFLKFYGRIPPRSICTSSLRLVNSAIAPRASPNNREGPQPRQIGMRHFYCDRSMPCRAALPPASSKRRATCRKAVLSVAVSSISGPHSHSSVVVRWRKHRCTSRNFQHPRPRHVGSSSSPRGAGGSPLSSRRHCAGTWWTYVDCP